VPAFPTAAGQGRGDLNFDKLVHQTPPLGVVAVLVLTHVLHVTRCDAASAPFIGDMDRPSQRTISSHIAQPRGFDGGSVRGVVRSGPRPMRDSQRGTFVRS
jgi:hypothetical protein